MPTKYVDTQNSKQDTAINNKLSKDGTNFMTGRLDTNNNQIINLADTTFPEGDSINYRIFSQERLTVRNVINGNLPRDGTKQMRGNLDM